MTPEHWQQVKELFNAAIEREPQGRALFLDEACSGNNSLRSEVESLIASYEKTGDFIDAPAYEVAAGLIVEQKSGMATGQTMGSYRILSTLGRGGMGEVYLAEDTRLGRKVALKFLPASYNTDSERLRRFEREARAASALNHPNILTIYEVGAFDGRQFIATEYVEGETLRQRQYHSALKLNEVLDLAVQVASALSAAHQAGIIHRDIKPENIMLRPDGFAKVVDFGLAKLTEATKNSGDTSASTMMQGDTGTGVVMGTTAYMSPEQTRGQELDPRTDIWSLGVVLYELLSGTMPFKGDTPSDLIVSILERDPSPLVATALLPSELDWIIRKALRKDREERYQTAREFLGDLRGLKQQVDFAAQLERSATPDTPKPVDQTPTYSHAPNANRATAEPRPAATVEIEANASRLGLTPATTRTHSKRLWLSLSLLGLLLVGVVLAAYKFLPLRKTVAPFQSMNITRLTNSGKAIDATLSPDGKYLVYVLSDAGQQSLWIRQVTSSNDKQIVAPAPVGFFGVSFSPDGNDLFYAVKANLDRGTLYRVQTLGGTPVKILEGIDGPVSFSPDSKQVTLIRTNPSLGGSELVIANADGSGERVLAVRKPPEMFSPIFFTGPSWSPDGRLIAAAIAKHGSGSHVYAFAVADGKETELTSTPWSFVGRVQWMPDMSGLLVVGGETAGVAQVFFLSYPDGAKRRITNDLNTYRALSLAADGSKFSTIQSSGLVNIWIAPEGDARRSTPISTGNVGFFGAPGNSLSWTTDGRIVFVSNESGSLDLWSMDPNGGNRRQLTSQAGQNTSPAVTHDGRHIVFQSSRAGARNIWRIDVDGGNPTRLTTGIGDGLPSISPDDKWVFYTALSGYKPTLWKVSIDGGTPVEVDPRVAAAPTISPDGRWIAFLFPESQDPLAPPNRIGIIPAGGGEPSKAFAFQPSGTIAPYAQWAADGKSILYPVNNNNVTNVWSQPVDGGAPKQVTDFRDSLMTGFSWSRDGKTFACTRGVLIRDAVLISEAK